MNIKRHKLIYENELYKNYNSFFVIFTYMIKEGIKRLIYNNIKHVLTIVYTSGEERDVEMSEEEYEDMISSGKFNF